MNTKVNEGKLISGREALIALANGSVVQGNIGFGWIDVDLNDDVLLNSFITERNRCGVAVKFRLKPRTVSINGIEVPAPFEPKSGDMVWCLNELSEKGYEARTTYNSDDFTAHIAYWRTEEEIKQVVATLRQVFGGSYDN